MITLGSTCEGFVKLQRSKTGPSTTRPVPPVRPLSATVPGISASLNIRDDIWPSAVCRSRQNHINHFAIHCADDGSSDYGARNRTQHRDAAHSSNNGHELLWPNGADRLVPTALVSHEEALLAAFLATKNVTELILTDHYWSNSTTEGNEPEHRDLPARRPISRQAERRTLYDFVCDITSTFNLIMSLVAQAGLAPTRITTSSLPGANLVTGLSSAIGLVTYKQALLQLEGLDLVFVDESRDELGTVEAA